MLDKVTGAIKEYRLIEKGDKVLVAVSGGPDSVALLMALIQLSKKLKFTLAAAHLNHRLRGKEADEDANFVKALAKSLNIPLASKEVDIKSLKQRRGGSIEEVARDERYAFLCSTAAKMGCNKIALGHNLNDNAETTLMNLLRGSGVKGLGGIPPHRQMNGVELIRPLIAVTRKEILAYLRRRKAKYRTDSTNVDTTFKRNRIRHKLIPLLGRDYNPKVTLILGETARVMRQTNQYLESEVQRLTGDLVKPCNAGFCLKRKELLSLHPFIRKELFRGLLTTRFNITPELSLLEKMDRFIAAGRSGKINISNSVAVYRQYSDIIVGKTPEDVENFEKRISIPARTFLGYFGTQFSAEIVNNRKEAVNREQKPPAFFDVWENICGGKPAEFQEFLNADNLPEEKLIIRNRRSGDRYQPIGFGRDKKVKEIFIDEKIHFTIRPKIPLLLCGSDILWIMGYRINEKYKVTQSTRKVLRVEARIFYYNKSA